MNKVEIINRKGSTEIFLNNTRLHGVKSTEIVPIVDRQEGMVIGTELIVKFEVDELNVVNKP